MMMMMIEWYWYVRIAPISLRILAVLAAMMSLIVVWCEVTFFSDTPILSIINLLIHSDLDTLGTYVIFSHYFIFVLFQTNKVK
jgi:hypothetical protein